GLADRLFVIHDQDGFRGLNGRGHDRRLADGISSPCSYSRPLGTSPARGPSATAFVWFHTQGPRPAPMLRTPSMPPSLPSPSSTPNDPGAVKPKSALERILTITPVVLTLLSTLLAGLSSSEMVRAQYYRSLAAQYQSKAADQWGFFQSKRIRSTVIDQDLDLFPGAPVRVAPEELGAAMRRMAGRLREGGQAAEQLVSAVDTAKDLGPTGQALGRSAHRLADIGQETGTDKSLENALNQLETEAVKTALSYLGTERMPSAGEERKVNDLAIDSALKAIRERQPESTLVPLVRPIDETQLREAVEAAEANSKAFE